MATITPGTGGTFQASTAEGQAIEAIVFLKSLENDALKNPTSRAGVGWTLENGTTLRGTYNLPATQTLNNGSLAINATAYIVDHGYLAGSGGTFNAVTPESALLERLMYLQSLENSGVTGSNPDNRNFVTGSFNSDTQLYAGTFSLPVLSDLVVGAIATNPVPYLT